MLVTTESDYSLLSRELAESDCKGSLRLSCAEQIEEKNELQGETRQKAYNLHETGKVITLHFLDFHTQQ